MIRCPIRQRRDTRAVTHQARGIEAAVDEGHDTTRPPAPMLRTLYTKASEDSPSEVWACRGCPAPHRSAFAYPANNPASSYTTRQRVGRANRVPVLWPAHSIVAVEMSRFGALLSYSKMISGATGPASTPDRLESTPCVAAGSVIVMAAYLLTTSRLDTSAAPLRPSPLHEQSGCPGFGGSWNRHSWPSGAR